MPDALDTHTAPAGAHPLSSVLGLLSGGANLAECARNALEASSRGISVAVGLVGGPLVERVRNHRRQAATSLVSRGIAEHVQRSFGRVDTAHNSGREWLVSRAGQPGLEVMDNNQFQAYRDELAARGATLMTLVYKGNSLRDISAVLTRYVGGMVDGATAQQPAIISVTSNGIERAFFAQGQRLQEPESQSAPTPGARI